MNTDATSVTGMPYFPGIAVGVLRRGLAQVTSDTIVMLTQAEILKIPGLPAGFIIVDGAPFSHNLIALLSHARPCVLISHQQAKVLTEGARLALDGCTGEIYESIDSNSAQQPVLPSLTAGQPIFTADNCAVNLCASVRHTAAASRASVLGAQSIGLVRTEFILPDDNSVPDAIYYQQAFRDICRSADPLALTFRLLDLSIDKIPPWIPQAALRGSLGLQGVRLYGMEPVRSVIRAQLTAINDLQADYHLRLLIPYLVRYEEMQYWVDRVYQQLPETLPVGVMVETPASSLDLGNWLAEVDFVAIGCNDLMQCLFAADRDQPELGNYLDPYAPFLYRFFQQMAEAAGDKLGSVQLCGLLSQIQGVIPLLIGLGYRTFSVDAAFIPYLANTVLATKVTDAQALARQVCDAQQSREVLEILHLSQRHVPYLT